MKCPHCNHPDDHVIDSRPVESANLIRRRRECLGCHKRFTTYERYEAIPIIVIKSDNRREPFSREKLQEGIARACKNRAISSDQIEKLVSEVEQDLQEEYVMEAPSHIIGDLVLSKLKSLDNVAFIRFMSVYKQFGDIDAFIAALNDLKKESLKKKKVKKNDVPEINQNISYSKN